MEIQWHESLATGVDKIDDQHKEIIARINTLINMDMENMDSEEMEHELQKVLRFLGGYVIDHFNAEEEIMTRYHYPEYDEHKKEHLTFLKNFATLKRMFEKEGTTSLMITATQNQAVDWLVKHIKNIDQKMAAFLKSKMQP
ncbi:MAG: hemerythrin family protein [Nitrospirae bacterium]|nr:hemerythrin family protein [Nitrospirota bacterium]